MGTSIVDGRGSNGLAVTLDAELMRPSLQESDIQPNGGSASRRRNTCLPLGMNRAFTLIELLVAIAIIAILAALLLPTLNQAKNRANLATDLNHFHQILLATHMYCADNNDVMPQPGWIPGGAPTTWCNAGSMSFPIPPLPLTQAAYPAAYAAQVACYKGTPPYKKAAQLYPYLRNPKALRCPADVFGPNTYKRWVLITSYNWNPAVVGYDLIGPVLRPYKLRQFKADAILLWENDETESMNWDDAAEYPDENVSTRHGQVVVVGLFGGGAQIMGLTDFYWLAAHQRTKWPGPWGAGWLNFPGHKGLPNQLWCNPGHPYGAHN